MSCGAIALTEPLLAEELRQRREDRALSGRALARLSGLSTRTIQRIEHGEYQPSQAVLDRLAEALEMDELEIGCAAKSIQRGSFPQLRDVVPWELDPCAQYAVASHPDGLTLEEVAELLGLSVRTVIEVEKSALEKLRTAGAELREFLTPEAGQTHEYGVRSETRTTAKGSADDKPLRGNGSRAARTAGTGFE